MAYTCDLLSPWCQASQYSGQVLQQSDPSQSPLHPEAPGGHLLPSAAPKWPAPEAWGREVGMDRTGFQVEVLSCFPSNCTLSRVASLIPTICIPFRRSVTPVDVWLSHTPTYLQPRAQLLWLFFLMNLQVIKRRKHKTAKQGNQILVLASAVLLTAQAR